MARQERFRESGILLHLSSLPSPYGIGDMGPEAYRFVDFLSRCGQRVWQVLPLNPTGLAFGNSPYHCPSVFAGNSLFISPELLVRDGLLDGDDANPPRGLPAGSVDYGSATALKEAVIDHAFHRFLARSDTDFDEFCRSEEWWLEDFALFAAAKNRCRGRVWGKWPEDVRDRRPEALEAMRRDLREGVLREKFRQYLFFRQWRELRSYCRSRGVTILGDLPIYPTYDSADLWANPALFKLDDTRFPVAVAGVPPDYFSRTGQLWGNPVYDWESLRAQKFQWWVRRLGHNLSLFDRVRIDHFRGLVAFWEVPAGEKTAVGGKWVEVPEKELFEALLKVAPEGALVAEDLGTITPDVVAVLERLGLPGMKVLLFAFGEKLGPNLYLPHNHIEKCIVYTGTHDNNTVRGWYVEEADGNEKRRLSRYLDRSIEDDRVHWEFVRMALSSVARTAIIPMQDLLGLGAGARMNRPAVSEGNWRWRLEPRQITPELEENLLELTSIYGRL